MKFKVWQAVVIAAAAFAAAPQAGLASVPSYRPGFFEIFFEVLTICLVDPGGYFRLCSAFVTLAAAITIGAYYLWLDRSERFRSWSRLRRGLTLAAIAGGAYVLMNIAIILLVLFGPSGVDDLFID